MEGVEGEEPAQRAFNSMGGVDPPPPPMPASKLTLVTPLPQRWYREERVSRRGGEHRYSPPWLRTTCPGGMHGRERSVERVW